MTDSRAYQALARRYRPAQFEGPRGLIGQPHVAQTLMNAVRTKKLANAYLLCGPRGTGKTTSARILAAALNCERRAPEAAEPCAECESCTRIIFGKETPDVIEIDAATNRSVEDARNLRQAAQFAPSSATAYKVYIVDECHMLSKEAWNALLKTLEEPPPRVIFVFCTTEPQKIAQAATPVLSRCQRFDMRRIAHADIVGALTAIAAQEGIAIDEEALTLVARRADGGMRDALSLLDQLRAFQGDTATITAETVREALGMQPETVYLGVLDLIADREQPNDPRPPEKRARGRIFKLIHHLDTQGADFVRFFEDLQDAIAALALVQEGGSPEGWSDKGRQGLMKRAGYVVKDGAWVRDPQAQGIPTATLVRILHLCQENMALVRSAPRPSTVVLTVLQLAVSLASTPSGAATQAA